MWNPFRKLIGSKLAKDYTTSRVNPNPRIQRSVKDTETDQLVSAWSSRATPPVNFTDLHQSKMVGRARDICINNSYGKAALRVLRQNVVGENGIRMQSHVKTDKGDLDRDINSAIEERWAKYTKAINFDVAGRKNLKGFLYVAFNSMITDGEFFLRKHMEPSGIKWQEIDAMRIPPSASNRYRLKSEGQVYKNGIIFSEETGKPLYYCLNRDRIDYYEMQPDRFTHHVPAGEMLHGFQQESMGQCRGIPLGQTTSETLYMIGKYAEAALKNAQVGARKLGFFTQSTHEPPPTTAKVDDEGNPVTDDEGNVIIRNVMDGLKLDLKHGSINSLPPGVDFSAFEPEYPNNEYEAFMKVMLRGTSVGFSIPYSDISGDLSDVNYSSMRQGALEIRANYRILQDFLILYFMEPIFMEWLVFELMHGLIMVNGSTLTIDMIDRLHKPVFTAKRWAWIDPRAEAIANQIAIKQGLKSPSQIIKEMGGDPEQVWESIKQDIETMKGLGLPEEFVYGIFAHQPATVHDLIEQVYASSGDGINDMSNQM